MAAEREEAERSQREQDERAAKAREKMGAQQRAQEAATAAEAERKKRKEQAAAHATSAPQKAWANLHKAQPIVDPPPSRSTPQSVDSKKPKEEPVAAKSSLDGTRMFS